VVVKVEMVVLTLLQQVGLEVEVEILVITPEPLETLQVLLQVKVMLVRLVSRLRQETLVVVEVLEKLEIQMVRLMVEMDYLLQ
jgi:hypothetical protein